MVKISASPSRLPNGPTRAATTPTGTGRRARDDEPGYRRRRAGCTSRRVMTEPICTNSRCTGQPWSPVHTPGWRYMISDVYPREADAFGDGTVPLHYRPAGRPETTLMRMDSVTQFFDDGHEQGERLMRVDLHPAWDQSCYTRCAFNGVLDGTRRVSIRLSLRRLDLCRRPLGAYVAPPEGSNPEPRRQTTGQSIATKRCSHV